MDEKIFNFLNEYTLPTEQMVCYQEGKNKYCGDECPLYMKLGVRVSGLTIGTYTTHCFSNLAKEILEKEE